MQGYLNKQISGLKYPPQTDIMLRKTIVISGKTMDEEKWKDCRLHTWVLQAKGPTQNRESPLSTLLFLLAKEITLSAKRFLLCPKTAKPPQPSKSNLTFSESFLPSCLKTTKQKLSPQKISAASNFSLPSFFPSTLLPQTILCSSPKAPPKNSPLLCRRRSSNNLCSNNFFSFFLPLSVTTISNGLLSKNAPPCSWHAPPP